MQLPGEPASQTVARGLLYHHWFGFLAPNPVSSGEGRCAALPTGTAQARAPVFPGRPARRLPGLPRLPPQEAPWKGRSWGGPPDDALELRGPTVASMPTRQAQVLSPSCTISHHPDCFTAKCRSPGSYRVSVSQPLRQAPCPGLLCALPHRRRTWSSGCPLPRPSPAGEIPTTEKRRMLRPDLGHPLRGSSSSLGLGSRRGRSGGTALTARRSQQ